MSEQLEDLPKCSRCAVRDIFLEFKGDQSVPEFVTTILRKSDSLVHVDEQYIYKIQGHKPYRDGCPQAPRPPHESIDKAADQCILLFIAAHEAILRATDPMEWKRASTAILFVAHHWQDNEPEPDVIGLYDLGRRPDTEKTLFVRALKIALKSRLDQRQHQDHELPRWPPN